MVLYLTHDQTESWNEGGWQALEVEETIVEDLDRLGSIPPVTVLDVTGQEICFLVAEGTVILCILISPPRRPPVFCGMCYRASGGSLN